MLLARTLIIASLASAVFGYSAECLADDVESVTVRVRSVRATGVLNSQDNSPIEVESDLEDLSPKLKKLHYRKFTLLDTQQRKVTLMQRETMLLIDGNKLTVKPLYVQAQEHTDRKRVGMWISWLDKTGEEILDTRMHFTCGENMVTGTDGTEDSGLILAISVSPE